MFIPNLIINDIPIKHVDEVNFLGLTINENLTWTNHIQKISCKLASKVGILNRLKQILPQHILLLLYNSLILPHINYMIQVWGHNNKKITQLQKRAIRVITSSKYLAHTEPLFKSLGILKVGDIFKLQQYKFYYRFIHNSLPDYFQNLVINRNMHHHNTRKREQLYPVQKKYFV